MQVIFSKIELKISPFLTVIQFYSNIVEKLVDKSLCCVYLKYFYQML